MMSKMGMMISVNKLQATKAVATAQEMMERGPLHMSLDLVPTGYQQKFAGQLSTSQLVSTKRTWRTLYGHFINFRIPVSRNFVVRGLFERSDLLQKQHDLWHNLYKGKRKDEILSSNSDLPAYENTARTNIIGKFGLELEGGWAGRPSNLRGDGSVHVFGVSYSGEVSTTPLSPVNYPWEREFFQRYPTSVNRTCGMHIHVSFRTLGMYASFVDKRFSDWLLVGLKKWAIDHNLKSKRLTSRLNGRNHYCQVPSNIDASWLAQQIAGEGDRYTCVNYEAYHKFKTMEIRVLPMFNMPKIGQKAIIETLRLVNVWGNAMGPTTRKPVRLFEARGTRE